MNPPLPKPKLFMKWEFVVRHQGLEPWTPALKGRCYYQLS